MDMRSFLTLIIIFLCWENHALYAQCTFSLSNETPCASEEAEFSVDAPQAGSNYSWDLDGDGQVDVTGSIFSYAFPVQHTATTYTITLFKNGAACAQRDITVPAVPDPAIGVPPGIVTLTDKELRACNGASSFELEIFNASSTYASNTAYTINWGDGSPAEEYDNSTFSNANTISHTYNRLGYYTIFITATHENGCVYTDNYTFYNGGNPSVGLAIPGNTVGLCAPATLDFPITNTEGNPPGTEYTVFISGEEVGHFTQENLPPVFRYTFLESSCGRTTSTGNYPNAFDIRVVASNPCNSSTATIEPIEVSEPPEPNFSIIPPEYSCEGAVYTFENNSDVSEVVSGSPSSCVDVLNPSWSITGTSGEDWNIVSGNLFGANTIEAEFLTPGVYTIEMTLVSFSCGPVSFSQEITIDEPPVPEADIQMPDVGGGGENGCTPLRVPLNASATGEELNYQWSVSPAQGWYFTDSTDANSLGPVIEFTEGGAYDITLSVSNACAEASWDTMLLLPGAPVVDMAPLPDHCESATLSFDSSLLNIQANGLDISGYQWSFPGGTPSSSSEPYPSGIHYGSPGQWSCSWPTAAAIQCCATPSPFRKPARWKCLPGGRCAAPASLSGCRPHPAAAPGLAPVYPRTVLSIPPPPIQAPTSSPTITAPAPAPCRARWR